MNKIAIYLLSDPKGGEESLGRLLNGLAFAQDAKRKGDEVALVFSGTGTRWPAELAKLDHPARELYDSVREQVQGASCGCASAFGASESVEACGVPLLKDQELEGTPGISGIRNTIDEGYQTYIF